MGAEVLFEAYEWLYTCVILLAGITSTYAQMCLEMVLIQKLTSQICVTAGLESEV